MRVSLVTRIVAGYLLVLLLLGGVAAYAIWNMSEMKQEVLIVKRGLLPTSGKLQNLSAELSKGASVLTRGNQEQVVWLSHYLPEIKPFATLHEIESTLNSLATQQKLPEKTRSNLAAIAARVAKLGRSETVHAMIGSRMKRWKDTPDSKTNREVYRWLVIRFQKLQGAGSSQNDEALRRDVTRSLGLALRAMRKEVMGIEAAYNLAINTAWSDTTEKEESAVTVALLMGLASLVVIVGVFFLFLLWLKPIGQLRTFANRISRGEYDHPVPTRRADEIGALATELKTMAMRLKEREEMIRSQARELLRADRFSTIGKMATQIAHEVRNPLNALGLKLEMLDEDIDDAQDVLAEQTHQQFKKSLTAIGKEIDRLRDITDYYLKFAKFPEVERETVDLHTVLTDVVGFYEEEVRRNGITMEKDIQRNLRAEVDPNLIRHAVTNLLKNAAEALSEAQTENACISVRAWRELQTIRISVKDNGPGLPQDGEQRVFEPFFSTKKSGTGLGLTLVQQVSEEHGGEVTCTSSKTQGTTFRITLPS